MNKSNQLARYLAELGIGPDVPVALCLERSLYIPLALLATVKAGGGYVPFDPSQPSDRLEYMIADTKAPLILTTSALRGRIPNANGKVLCLDEVLPTLARYDSHNLPAQRRRRICSRSSTRPAQRANPRE